MLKTKQQLEQDFLTGEIITEDKLHDFLDTVFDYGIEIEDPDINGFAAPLRTIVYTPLNKFFKKMGEGDTDWIEIYGGGSGDGYIISEETVGDSQSATIDTIEGNDIHHVEWTLGFNDETNFGTAKLIVTTNWTNVSETFTSTTDIGDNSDLVFEAQIDDGNLILVATNNSSSTYTIKSTKLAF